MGEKNGSSSGSAGGTCLDEPEPDSAVEWRSRRSGSCPASTLPQLVRLLARLAVLSEGLKAGEDGADRPVGVPVKSIAEEAELSEECWSESCGKSTIDYLSPRI